MEQKIFCVNDFHLNTSKWIQFKWNLFILFYLKRLKGGSLRYYVDQNSGRPKGEIQLRVGRIDSVRNRDIAKVFF